MIKDSESSSLAKSARRKRTNADILRRPIICICNDLYVPALRQLRQSAFLVAFHAASPIALSARLLEVALRFLIHIYVVFCGYQEAFTVNSCVTIPSSSFNNQFYYSFVLFLSCWFTSHEESLTVKCLDGLASALKHLMICV